MFILWRYILRAHVGPFAFATILLMFVFLLQFLMKFLDELAGKGLGYGVIAELVMLNLAWMVVLAVPMAVLMGTVMAFGQLASTNQVTAMRASGVSLYRMIAPVLVAATVVCLVLVEFNNEVLPDANHKTKVLTNDIRRKKPTLTIVPGLFSQLMQGYSILVQKTFEESNNLEGVKLFDYSQPGTYATITAERGGVSFSSDYRKLILDLTEGEIHKVGLPDFKEYRTIRFIKHRIAMNAEDFEFQRSREGDFGRGDRELSTFAMQTIVDSLSTIQQHALSRWQSLVERHREGLYRPNKSDPRYQVPDPVSASLSQVGILRAGIDNEQAQMNYYDFEARKYKVEIHKKYAIPVACLVFVLIGAPLGIMARRGTFGVGASLSLGFFLIYWACLIGGEKLADRGLIEPWVGMWIANITLGLLGGYLTFRTARENLTINWSGLARLIPERWRSIAQEEEQA